MRPSPSLVGTLSLTFVTPATDRGWSTSFSDWLSVVVWTVGNGGMRASVPSLSPRRTGTFA
eukprot:4260532-Pyramimonas_sp.AAC.1